MKRALDVVGFDQDEFYVVMAVLEAIMDILKVLEESVSRQVLVGLFHFKHKEGAASAAIAGVVAVVGSAVVGGVDHYLTDNVVDGRTNCNDAISKVFLLCNDYKLRLRLLIKTTFTNPQLFF